MDPLKFFKSENKTHISNKKYQKSREIQPVVSRITLSHIHDLSKDTPSFKSVEFFFYTNTFNKTQNLCKALKKRNYEISYCGSDDNGKTFAVIGSTPEMGMDDDTFSNWTEEMNDLGYKLDCEFDGWGVLLD